MIKVWVFAMVIFVGMALGVDWFLGILGRFLVKNPYDGNLRFD